MLYFQLVTSFVFESIADCTFFYHFLKWKHLLDFYTEFPPFSTLDFSELRSGPSICQLSIKFAHSLVSFNFFQSSFSVTDGSDALQFFKKFCGGSIYQRYQWQFNKLASQCSNFLSVKIFFLIQCWLQFHLPSLTVPKNSKMLQFLGF